MADPRHAPGGARTDPARGVRHQRDHPRDRAAARAHQPDRRGRPRGGRGGGWGGPSAALLTQAVRRRRAGHNTQDTRQQHGTTDVHIARTGEGEF